MVLGIWDYIENKVEVSAGIGCLLADLDDPFYIFFSVSDIIFDLATCSTIIYLCFYYIIELYYIFPLESMLNCRNDSICFIQ